MVAGIIRRQSNIIFYNYIGLLDVSGTSISGALGGLVGELSFDTTKCSLTNASMTVKYRGLTSNGWK